MKMSNKPTRGLPLTEAERDFKPSKGWVGGTRFEYTSKHGSNSSNSGIHKKKKAKPLVIPVRLSIMPKWGWKYLPSPKGST